MANRCSIEIEDNYFCKIYMHWGDDHSSMLEKLEDFNEKFTTIRGYDPSYKIAQLLIQTHVYFKEWVSSLSLDNPRAGTGGVFVSTTRM